MSAADPELLNRAAVCFQRAGFLDEAARCYRAAGAYRRAGELHERIGRFREAAADYALGDNLDLAAWVLVHHADDPAAARDRLDGAAAPAMPSPVLRRRVVLARCAVAERAPAARALAVLADVCVELARPRAVPDPWLESWAVAVGAAMARPDQVALVFAAAIRGGRADAEGRWRTWMRETMRAELVLPAPTPGGG